MQLNSAHNRFAGQTSKRWTMKQWNLFMLSVLLLLLSDLVAVAQPTCSSTFSAFDTCNPNYRGSAYVFVGRVVSLEVLTTNSGRLQKAVVAVETVLKGQLDSEVEVRMPTRCFGVMAENRSFIFAADQSNGNEFIGFSSSKWSTPVENIPAAEMEKILDEIRAVLRGVPQPRLVGSVIEQRWNPDGRYQTMRSWLDPQLGYDSKYARQLRGIEVVAQDKAGNQFTTKTDAKGRFIFDKLASGTYGVHPILPRKMDLYANGSPLKEGEKHYIEIGDELCSAELNFDAQLTGSIVGRLENESADWKRDPILYLVRVESAEPDKREARTDFTRGYISPAYVRRDDHRGASYEFVFDRVPIGFYVLLYVADTARGYFSLFYPTVSSYQDAQVIEVRPAQRTNVNIKLNYLTQKSSDKDAALASTIGLHRRRRLHSFGKAVFRSK
jgi:hypothetical protein